MKGPYVVIIVALIIAAVFGALWLAGVFDDGGSLKVKVGEALRDAGLLG